MSCTEYWESQGIDVLDAMYTVGCPNAAGKLPVHGISAAVFGAMLLVALLIWLDTREGDGGLFR